MTMKPSIWTKLTRVVLCFLALTMFTSSKAHAQLQIMDIERIMNIVMNYAAEQALWTSEHTNLDQQSQVIQDLHTTLIDEFNLYADEIAATARTLVGAIQNLVINEGRATQAVIDADTLNTLMKANMTLAYEQTVPKHEYMCKSVFAHQLPVTAEEAEREVARVIVDSFAARYRCDGCDGSYSDWENAARRGLDGPRGDVVTGMAHFGSQVDGYALNEGLQTNAALVDADIKPLMRGQGQVLVMPRITGTNYNRSYVPLDDDQVAWIGKLSYLMNVAGPVPTPLRGANIGTPAGRDQRSAFNHCRAAESALVKPCADLQAFYTRPNCRRDPNTGSLQSPSSEELCESQRTLCLAATGSMIDPAEFGNCEDGLSPYESGLLEVLMCKSQQHHIFQSSAGASFGDQLKTTELCSLAWDSFQDLVNIKHQSCTRAVAAMGDMGACWNSVDSSGYFAEAEAFNKKRSLVSSPYIDFVKPRALPISAHHEKGTLPSGKVLLADDIEWPKSVWQ